MRPLKRPEQSSAEIAELRALGTTQCLAHVREHGVGFAPETIVFLMRQAAASRNTELFELCGRLLCGWPTRDDSWSGGHCEAIIASLSRVYGFARDIELREAFRARCLSAMFMAVHAGSERKAFWEERFGAAFKAACIDVARALGRRRVRDMEAGVANHAVDEVDVDDLDSGEPFVDDSILDALAKPYYEAAILTAVRDLPPRQGQAAMLRWHEGRQIEGDGDETVAAIMGISARAVYAHLDKALATLRANPTLRQIWQGEV